VKKKDQRVEKMNVWSKLKVFRDVWKLDLDVFGEHRRRGLFFKMLLWLLGSKQNTMHYKYNSQTLVGFCFMNGNRIGRLAVKKEHRKKGIAQTLVPEYAEIARTGFNNNAARRLYKKIGFNEWQIIYYRKNESSNMRKGR